MQGGPQLLHCWRCVQVDEALGSSRLSAEEWQARQAAMAKNSALLFYQEHKAKRLKKIKSKAYHRHLKKKAAKAMPADDEASQQARSLLLLLRGPALR